MQPKIYNVTAAQVGSEDISQFLRSAISREFGNKEYFIANELTTDRFDPERNEMRKLRAFLVQFGNESVTLYFDITEPSKARSSTNSWGL